MSKMNLNNMLRVNKEKRVNSLQVKNCAGVVGNSSLLAPQVKNKPYKKQVKSALAASVLQEGGVNPSAVAKNMAALALLLKAIAKLKRELSLRIMCLIS